MDADRPGNSQFRHSLGEVFLNASMVSTKHRGIRLLARERDQPFGVIDSAA